MALPVRTATRARPKPTTIPGTGPARATIARFQPPGVFDPLTAAPSMAKRHLHIAITQQLHGRRPDSWKIKCRRDQQRLHDGMLERGRLHPEYRQERRSEGPSPSRSLHGDQTPSRPLRAGATTEASVARFSRGRVVGRGVAGLLAKAKRAGRKVVRPTPKASSGYIRAGPRRAWPGGGPWHRDQRPRRSRCVGAAKVDPHEVVPSAADLTSTTSSALLPSHIHAAKQSPGRRSSVSG